MSIYQPMKYWWLYFMISLAVIIPGVYSLARSGLRLGIDFTGGTTISLAVKDVSGGAIRETAEEMKIDVKNLDEKEGQIRLTTAPLDRTTYQSFLDKVKTKGEVQELSYDTVGPSLGSELVKKTIYGLVLAASLILLYVAYRFQNLKFGLSAILAMLHDSLVLLGVFSMLGYYLKVEVDTLFVTALLTILSFSVHDTIVVFDRIRELHKKHGHLGFEETVNRAVVETMSRSVNNSMTIIFMLLAMYLLGGETTRWFILALLVGTVSGTYSSTFTAAPILVVMDKLSRNAKLRKLNKKK